MPLNAPAVLASVRSAAPEQEETALELCNSAALLVISVLSGGRLVSTTCLPLSAIPCCGSASITEFVHLFFREVLDTHKDILRPARANEFVELYLQGLSLAVLSILNQEHHQKRNDCGPSID